MNTIEFLEAWVNDKLGRKIKYGHYYIKTFDKHEYLCHFNSESQGMPYLIAVKIRLITDYIILRDEHNGKMLGACEGYKFLFHAPFGDMNRDKVDITRIKVLNQRIVNHLSSGAPIYMLLLDMDSTRYYTEFKGINWADSISEYVALTDLTTHPSPKSLTSSLRKIEGYPDNVQEARRFSIPEQYRDKEGVKVTSNLILVPDELDATISEDVWEKAKWKPNPKGFNIPGDLCHYDDRLTHWVMNRPTREVNQRIRKEHNEGVVERVELFKQANEQHKRAVAKIEEHLYTPEDKLLNVGISCDPANLWGDNGILWLKGKINLRSGDGNNNHKVDLGDQWYKVVTNG